MFKILFSIAILVGLAYSATTLSAQTTDLGQPRSWKGKLSTQQITAVVMPRFDLAALVAEDAINDAQKIGVWRFGYSHQVALGLDNAGVWETLPSGDRVWRLKLESRQALSMNLLFSEFTLSQGSMLHVYSSDLAQVQGAYTAANNNAESVLGTMPIKGESITVELFEPANSLPNRVRIGTVVHGYRDISVYAENQFKALNSSGKCNLDVKCPLGLGWEDQINSVAIIVVNGAGSCTGALINNTANDGTPYFLTANHCTGGGSVANWVFRFNWDSPTAVCSQNAASTNPPTPNNDVNGAVLRANRAGSDFALLQLNSAPTGDVYYSGWERTSAIPAGGVTAIHHPSGDVKKISRENDPTSQVTWQSALCWQIANWDNGTTEGGSSGSPLFNASQRIMGQLYGGGAACSGLINNNQSDNYGRFDISWATGTTNATRLSNWLDPTNSGVMFIDGYNPNTPLFANDAATRAIGGVELVYCNQNTVSPIATIRNFGSAALTSAVINYGIQGGSNSTFNWTGSLAFGATTTVALPSLTGSTGTNTVYIYTTLPNGIADPNTANDTTRFAFEIISGGLTVPFTILPDCYASETSWDIINANNVILARGEGYADASNPSPIVNQLCLPVGCYTLRVYDSYGDGLRGNYGFASCTINGDFFVVSPAGDTLVNLNVTNSDFGSTSTNPFCITTPVAPTAAFVAANNNNICAGNSLTFTNQSTGGTSYAWSFEGGSPATSTMTSPAISYNTAGVYSVTLTASNSIGSNSRTQTALVTVTANSIAINGAATANNLTTNVSGGNAPYTYRWSNNATTANISPATAGAYTVTVTDANGCRSSQTLTASAPVGVNLYSSAAFDAQLLPNPANDFSSLVINNFEEETLNIQVFSLTGQSLTQMQANNNGSGVIQARIDISALPAGVYIVQLRSQQQQQVLKLVKQ
jgi:hypothetical protein